MTHRLASLSESQAHAEHAPNPRADYTIPNVAGLRNHSKSEWKAGHKEVETRYGRDQVNETSTRPTHQVANSGQGTRIWLRAGVTLTTTAYFDSFYGDKAQETVDIRLYKRNNQAGGKYWHK